MVFESVTKGDDVNKNPPPYVVIVTKEKLIQHVLRNLDEAF